MTVDTVTRQEKVERWVALSAITTLLQSLAIAFEHDSKLREPLVLGLDETDLCPGGSDELFDELWPDDDALASAEHLVADRRSSALTARALVMIATDEGRDLCLRLAVSQAGFAGMRK